ncbi:MAG TPA: ABC transporter permease subunit [Clostridia bacterium]|nr:ABC transporter permease subunit [Clostridia bacterium]
MTPLTALRQTPARRANQGLAKAWGHRYLYAMLLLPVAYYVIFCYWPMYGVQIAFRKYNLRLGVFGSPWVGLKYFQQYLADPYFWKVVRNTLLINVYSLIFSFPAPILLALLLNELKSEKYKRLVQSISYMPHFISTVVICGMITNFLANDGFVNNILAGMGYARIQFLMKPGYFRTIFIGSGIWQGIGWGSIIYLAAISGVDVQLYEAAIIDGAGRFRQALHVTIPAILPTVTIMLIMAVGGLMSSGAEKILLLYNGSTYETADVIATYVYRQGIESANYSYSTAVGIFSSVIGMLFLYGANFVSRAVSENSLW